jgi:hypothetical protein
MGVAFVSNPAVCGHRLDFGGFLRPGADVPARFRLMQAESGRQGTLIASC